MCAKKLGFGCMRLPLTDPNNDASIDMTLLCRMVDTFLERGFTYFDTAWMYCGGKSEEAMREALVKRHPRDSYTLTTKLPAYMLQTREDRDKVFNTQLERTGAGYFDYYLLHDVNDHSVKTFRDLDCFTWIREKKEQGLIRHMGFSFHGGAKLLDELLTEHPEIELVQLQINYLDWDSDAIQSRLCYEVCEKHGKKVLVMEPVKGGTLAKVPGDVEAMFKSYDPKPSIASWAIRFAASLPNVMIVLSGMSDMEQLLDNTGYMADFKPLTQEETALCTQAAEMINTAIAVPCTGCSYCTVNCPMNIAIPQYFSVYNVDQRELAGKGWTPQFTYFANLTTRFGKPSECVECGQCEEMCPQHLPIRKYLKDVSARFEG